MAVNEYSCQCHESKENVTIVWWTCYTYILGIIKNSIKERERQKYKLYATGKHTLDCPVSL